MPERKKATAVVAARYQKAREKEKGVILDEFTKLTGYGRQYASYVLRCHGKKVRIRAMSYKAISERKQGGRTPMTCDRSFTESGVVNVQAFSLRFE